MEPRKAATLSPIRRRLPRHWGRWLVEGLAEEVANGKETGQGLSAECFTYLLGVCVSVCPLSV